MKDPPRPSYVLWLWHPRPGMDLQRHLPLPHPGKHLYCRNKRVLSCTRNWWMPLRTRGSPREPNISPYLTYSGYGCQWWIPTAMPSPIRKTSQEKVGKITILTWQTLPRHLSDAPKEQAALYLHEPLREVRDPLWRRGRLWGRWP